MVVASPVTPIPTPKIPPAEIRPFIFPVFRQLVMLVPFSDIIPTIPPAPYLAATDALLVQELTEPPLMAIAMPPANDIELVTFIDRLLVQLVMLLFCAIPIIPLA